MKRLKLLFIIFILFLSLNVKAVDIRSYSLVYNYFSDYDASNTETLDGNTKRGNFTLVDAFNTPFRFIFLINYNFIAGKTYDIRANFCIPKDFNYINFNDYSSNAVFMNKTASIIVNNRHLSSDSTSKCLNFVTKLTFNKNQGTLQLGQINNDADTAPWFISPLPSDVYNLPVVWHSVNIEELQNPNDILNARLDGVIGSVQNKDKNDERRHKEAQNSRNEAEKTRKGILKTIIELPKKIVNLIVDGLKSLFIPKEGYINDKLTELLSFIRDKLGILFYPFELISDFFNMIIDFCKPGDGILEIPTIKEPFSGVILIEGISYNFGRDFKTALGEYYSLYQSFVYGICILLFSKFLYNYYLYIVEDKK